MKYTPKQKRTDVLRVRLLWLIMIQFITLKFPQSSLIGHHRGHHNECNRQLTEQSLYTYTGSLCPAKVDLIASSQRSVQNLSYDYPCVHSEGEQTNPLSPYTPASSGSLEQYSGNRQTPLLTQVSDPWGTTVSYHSAGVLLKVSLQLLTKERASLSRKL